MEDLEKVPLDDLRDKGERKVDVDDLIFCEAMEWYISDR